MSIIEIRGGRITHQYLMRKSKSELAYMVLDYLREIERLRKLHDEARQHNAGDRHE